MQCPRFLRLLSGGLLLALLTILTAGPVLADVSVVIGYETRSVGEIDPCG